MSSPIFVGSTIDIPLPVKDTDGNAVDPDTMVVVITCGSADPVTYTYLTDAALRRDGVGDYTLRHTTTTAGTTKVVVTTTLDGNTGVDVRNFTVVAP